METKVCARCGPKNIEEFNWNKRKNTTQTYCRECNREYQKEHYQKNKQKYKDKAKQYSFEYKREIYEWIQEYCLANPCVDCGETDFIVIDFDHIDPQQKNFEVSQAIGDGKSKELIKYEILNLCLPRCRNCHIRRTAIQFDWYLYMGRSSSLV